MNPQMRPTRRQLEVLRAYIATGSIAAAAYELGIGETTARQHLSGLYRRTGCVNAAQAAYWLGAEGWAGGHPPGGPEGGGLASRLPASRPCGSTAARRRRLV